MVIIARLRIQASLDLSAGAQAEKKEKEFRDYGFLERAYNNKEAGNALASQGKYTEALESYQEAKNVRNHATCL